MLLRVFVISLFLGLVAVLYGADVFEFKDCKDTKRGLEYNGKRAITTSGSVCQKWEEQTPHKHKKDDPLIFPGAASLKENYCRNPDNRTLGPWCFTTDPDVRIEGCGVPLCTQCKLTRKGLEYRGTQRRTVTGAKCQKWDRNSPHKHTRNNVTKFPEAIYNEEEYCRNPGGRNTGPYCFTRDKDIRWESCAIPYCDETVV